MLLYTYFLIEGLKAPFGYVLASSVQEISWPECWKIDHEKRFLTLTSATNFEQRTKLMQETLRRNIEIGSIQELTRWANELFPMYTADGEHVLDLDGSGVDLFGIVNYSVHMIGWVTSKEDGVRRYWVPRRATTKISFPGMLDNTVGGSLLSGERPIDCIVRECEEEISIDPAYTRTNIKACWTASYQMAMTDLGNPGCQHQVQYLFEMEFGKEIVPKIGVGEMG
ncbi:hypothetical protein MMC17_008605 [Xylographa soralifera]|nr:hypothetical protein [Xylographa soralifera]